MSVRQERIQTIFCRLANEDRDKVIMELLNLLTLPCLLSLLPDDHCDGLREMDA
jgi:hypothetical protein